MIRIPRRTGTLAGLAVVVLTAGVVGFVGLAGSAQAAPGQAAPAGSRAAAVTLPPANAVFDYQLGGAYAPIAAVGIVDRDRTASPAAGKYNICYINAFQTQPGESGSWPKAALLRTTSGKLVEDPEWQGEYLVDTRTDASRAAIMSVVGPWIDQCASKGFKAIEADNLDSYTRDPSKQLKEAGTLTLAQQLVARAHAAGLAIGQKNSVEIAPQGKAQIGFDFAVTESCHFYEECDGYTGVYGAQVYAVEYDKDGDGASLGGRSNFKAACTALGSKISITYRNYDVRPSSASGYFFEYC